MITGPRSLFAGRLLERGYTLDEVRGCIVSENGDQITVDETHPAYPRDRKPGYRPPRLETGGPGTELKKLLAKIGITATPTCSCNARAREMDARGIEWCEAHLDQIVGWLREEAAKRRLPFFDAAGRVLVRRAIANARKEQACAEEAKQAEGRAAV
jgi:hypothetical protein